MNDGYHPFLKPAEQIYTHFTQRQETEVQPWPKQDTGQYE